MALPDGFLDELKSRIRPSDLIGRTVALKRQGREFAGLSPFKKERTPSFFVNDEKGFYHCFASQEHGDVITWLQKTQGLSFMEAVEALAAEAGLEVPKSEPVSEEVQARRRSALEWIEAAQAWFRRQLTTPAGEAARAYLERRGLSAGDMETFGLGFAPDRRRGLVDALTQKGADVAELEEAGLVIVPEDGGPAYDRFRGRVMFPIEDARGRLVAFGGRALSKDVRAKYLNSPETSLFHKGSLLYRYPQARAFANDPKVKARGLIVAEGYMDVIAFARAGLGQAVAPLGTALTESQLKLLWRAGSEPVICLDGDSAGTRAAATAAERALPLLEPGKTLRFVFLPEGADPDDLLRDHGPKALKEAVASPKPLIDVIWERELAVEPLDDPDRRAGFRKRVKSLVKKISDPDVKIEYFNEIDQRISTLFQRVPVPQKGAVNYSRNRNMRLPSWQIEAISKEGRYFIKTHTPVAAFEAVSILFDALVFPKLVSEYIEELTQIDFGECNDLRDFVIENVDQPDGDFEQARSKMKSRFPNLYKKISGLKVLSSYPESPDDEDFVSFRSQWLKAVQFYYEKQLASEIGNDAKKVTRRLYEEGHMTELSRLRAETSRRGPGSLK